MNENYRITVNDVSHDLETCMFFRKKKKKKKEQRTTPWNMVYRNDQKDNEIYFVVNNSVNNGEIALFEKILVEFLADFYSSFL